MYDRELDDSPEERLWKAVIIQLLYDTQTDIYRYQLSLNGTRGHYWKTIMKHLRLAETPHMQTVCDMAGVSYNLLINTLYDIIYHGKEIYIPRFESNFKRHLDKRNNCGSI